jgi:hypothetical protein
MPRYILIAHDSVEWPDQASQMSAEEIEAVIARYRAWTDRLAAAGRLVLSEKLKDGEGRVLAAQRGSVRVTDGPHTASKEVIGGLWILEAASYEDAVALAQDSPHLEFGILELREIEEP